MTILGFGTVLHPILTKMEVKNKPKVLGEEEEVNDNCSNRFKKRLALFDTYYFAPLFIKDSRNIGDQKHNVDNELKTEATEMAEKSY